MANYKAVGRIRGSALDGLCERMCISVDCVTDACSIRRSSQTATVTLTDITAGAVPPFDFVGAQSTGTSEFTLLDAFPTENGCSNFTGRLRLPITVAFTDANGICRSGRGDIVITRQFALRCDGANPTSRIEGEGTLISISGAFLSDTVLAITYCIVETYKCVITADILVPTYGFAVFPDCRECNGCNALINSSVLGENEN